jgi:predicted DNA binding CopG/RHH family protein
MSDRHEKLLEQDFGAVWDDLATAPPLVHRPKTAQITLRMPDGWRKRIKAVAAARSLPYHALARAWLIDALGGTPPRPLADAGEPQSEQLNLKLDQSTLDLIKSRAHELRQPYHRLAREYIGLALAAEEDRIGLRAPTTDTPGIKDLVVLLLHARNAHGHDAVRGITRLQKLLFVLEQTLSEQPERFYAFNFGPFDESINDAANALEISGYLAGAATATSAGPPTFKEMMAGASKRAAAREQTPNVFQLNDSGHQAAENLRHSSAAYEALFDAVEGLREQWDTPDLLDRVYERWPQYTERSLIRDEVAERRERRTKT